MDDDPLACIFVNSIPDQQISCAPKNIAVRNGQSTRCVKHFFAALATIRISSVNSSEWKERAWKLAWSQSLETLSYHLYLSGLALCRVRLGSYIGSMTDIGKRKLREQVGSEAIKSPNARTWLENIFSSQTVGKYFIFPYCSISGLLPCEHYALRTFEMVFSLCRLFGH